MRIAQGGDSPLFPPPVSALVCSHLQANLQSNLSRISLKGQVQAKLLLKLVEIHQKWSEFWLIFQYEI